MQHDHRDIGKYKKDFTPFTDQKNHGWRVFENVYALDDDIKLQLQDARLREALEHVTLDEEFNGNNTTNTSAAGNTASAANNNKTNKDDVIMKQKLVILEDMYKERLDDEALAIVPSSWRLRERMKTVSVALVLALNIGTDPPDVIKTDPCARVECWIDPTAYSSARALELVARNLQAQFEYWQPRARYKYIPDPTVEAVKTLCTSMRRNAKEERMLFYFNGHGVPRPTANGEIWVFNSDYTKYMPLSVYDLLSWTGFPAIYTFDCSGAGLLLKHFLKHMEQCDDEDDAASASPRSKRTNPNGKGKLKECIVLMACAYNETLPASPDFPADIFTACLTTPMKIALRWFVMSNKSTMDALQITVDMVDKIPGKLNDRKTPLGELNWIFTAITDTIAWTILPRHLFRKLFRQDILVASLFRNFLLAERIFKSVHCTPQSYPPLPSAWQHHLWEAWDMAVENCVTQLPNLVPSLHSPNSNHEEDPPTPTNKTKTDENSKAPSINNDTSLAGDDIKYSLKFKNTEMGQQVPEYSYRQSDFFFNQLTSFEVWLASGENQKHRRVPEQLPIVLQLSLSSVHRVRALDLLARFLNLGAWAVSLALSVGIFPYVNKLLASPDDKIRPVLIHIWSKILALDTSCQSDLVKDMNVGASQSSSAGPRGAPQRVPSNNDGGVFYFLNQLRRLSLVNQDDNTPNEEEDQHELALEVNHCVKASFVLCVVVDGHPLGQQLCIDHGFIETAKKILLISIEPHYKTLLRQQISSLKEWTCLAISKLLERNPAGRHAARTLVDALVPLLHDPSIDVVQASIYALGSCIGSHTDDHQSKSPVLTRGRHSRGGHAQQTDTSSLSADCEIVNSLMCCLQHGSPTVRREMLLAFARFVVDDRHASLVLVTAHQLELTQSAAIRNSHAFSMEEGLYQEFMSKNARMLGENAETYLHIWLAIKRFASSDPFPAVQRIAEILLQHVRTGVSDRIGAIRSRAGIERNASQDFSSDDAKPSKYPMSSSTSPSPPVPSDADNQTTSDKLAQIGLCSSLHARRAKSFATLRVQTNRDSWVELDDPEHHEVNPLGKEGMFLLTCLRRNREAQQAARVLMTRGARWAGTPEPEDLLVNGGAGRTHFKDSSSKSTNTSSNNSESGDSVTKRSVPPTASPIRAIDANSDIMLDKLTVPPPSDKVQRRLDKLTKADSTLLVMNDPSWAVSKYVGIPEVTGKDKDASGRDLEVVSKTPKLKEVAAFEHGQVTCSKVLFHPYVSALVVAGEVDDITVWKYPATPYTTASASALQGGRTSKYLINEFSNNNNIADSQSPLNARITSILWMNETSEPMLCCGSDDGTVRVWKNVLTRQCPGQLNGTRLTSAWKAHFHMKARSKGPGLLLTWQQRCCHLLCAGKSAEVSIWDMNVERECGRAETFSRKESTCIASYGQRFGLGGFGVDRSIDYGFGSSVAGAEDALFFVGDGDGMITVFDKRVNSGGRVANVVGSLGAHRSWVVNLDIPQSNSGRTLISGSVSGEVCTWDIRRFNKSSALYVKQLDRYYENRQDHWAADTLESALDDGPAAKPTPPIVVPDLKFDAHRSPMTALVHHPHAPVFASGTHHRYIHLFNSQGDMLSTIRYHDGFFKQRISPVSSLAFHPYKLLLAAGSLGPSVTLYSPVH